MQRLSLNIRKLKNCLGAEESQEECSVRESWSPTGAEAGAPQGLTPGLAERAGPVGPEEAEAAGTLSLAEGVVFHRQGALPSPLCTGTRMEPWRERRQRGGTRGSCIWRESLQVGTGRGDGPSWCQRSRSASERPESSLCKSCTR